MNEIKWLDTEYCGSASATVQPVLVNGVLYYTLYAKGYHYVFVSVYAIHLHWSGVNNAYMFTCEREGQLEEYLKNF